MTAPIQTLELTHETLDVLIAALLAVESIALGATDAAAFKMYENPTDEHRRAHQLAQAAFARTSNACILRYTTFRRAHRAALQAALIAIHDRANPTCEWAAPTDERGAGCESS